MLSTPKSSSVINSQKILHLPYNPAGQLGIQAEALRALGLDVDYCIYENYYLDYEIPHALPKPASREVFFKECLPKYDVFHFHGGQTFFGWDDHHDLPIIKAHNKTTVMSFWGSEIRSKSIARVNNPWVEVKIENESWIKAKLEFFAKYIDAAIVMDEELYQYVKDFFPTVYKVPITSTPLTPVYLPYSVRPMVMHAPTSAFHKGTTHVQKAVENLKAAGLNFDYKEISGVTHAQALDAYKAAHIIVDQILVGSHGRFAIEAMQLGKPVVAYISPHLASSYPAELPIVSANPDTIEAQLKMLIEDPFLRKDLAKQGPGYANKYHNPVDAAVLTNDIYNTLQAEKVIAPRATPTVCLNMVVKNEEEVIERCLESLKPHIDYWVIADTGSTDSTKEKIQNVLNGVPGRLIDVPWVNFAHNRSAVLTEAKGKADYHLIIDADERLEAEPNYRDDLIHDCISGVVQYVSGFAFDRAMFLKDDADWKYEGVVHNYAVAKSTASLTSANITSCRIIHHCDGSSHKDSKTKYLRNAKTLVAELERVPTDTRSCFYAAESYRDAGEYALAKEYYQKRIDMGGWAEEVYWSYYQIALLSQDLDCYFAAYEYRPTRVEALYTMGILLSRCGKLRSAQILLEKISKLPAPEGERLFLDKALHNWKAKDALALVYYKLGLFEAALYLYENNKPFLEAKDIERNDKNIVACKAHIRVPSTPQT